MAKRAAIVVIIANVIALVIAGVAMFYSAQLTMQIGDVEGHPEIAPSTYLPEMRERIGVVFKVVALLGPVLFASVAAAIAWIIMSKKASLSQPPASR